MPANSAFRIKYPTSVAVSAASLNNCKVLYLTVTYTMTCSIDTGNSLISINSGLSVPVAAGGVVIVTFGAIVNPKT